MDMDSTTRELSYGTKFTITFPDAPSAGQFVIADNYADQYCVNWTTEITSSEFISLWMSYYKIQGLRAIIEGACFSFESHSRQTGYMVEESTLLHKSADLVRFWFDDLSIA